MLPKLKVKSVLSQLQPSRSVFAPKTHYFLQPKPASCCKTDVPVASWNGRSQAGHRDLSRTRRGQQQLSQPLPAPCWSPCPPGCWESIPGTSKRASPRPTREHPWSPTRSAQHCLDCGRLGWWSWHQGAMERADLPRTASFRSVEAVKAAAAAAAAFSVSRVSSLMSPLGREAEAFLSHVAVPPPHPMPCGDTASEVPWITFSHKS